MESWVIDMFFGWIVINHKAVLRICSRIIRTYLKFEPNKILQRIYFVQKSEKHLVYLEQYMQPAHLSSINHASLKQIIYKQKTTKP